MQFYNQLKGIGGSLVVTNPSDRAKLILDLCKLSSILLADVVPVALPHHKAEIRRFSSALASYEVVEYDLQKPLSTPAHRRSRTAASLSLWPAGLQDR